MGGNEEPNQPIKPRLSLLDAVSIMVGIVIGSSIFETPPTIFNNVANPALGMTVWVIGGALSLIGALCYAELASTYPRMGGDYVYLSRAFGSWAGFLFGWAQLAVILTASIGQMGFIFGRNAAAFMAVPSEQLRQTLEANPDAWESKVTLLMGVVTDENKDAWITALAIAAVIALSLMNVLGVILGKVVQNLLTLVKLAGLGAIIYFGFAIAQPVEFTVGKPGFGPKADFAVALLLVMYAFGGWNDMAFVASELRNKRNIPRALIAGTALITALYLAVNAAYILALGWDGVRQFNQPLASAVLGKELGDFAGRGMAVLVMVSALGAINGLIFTGSRVYSSLGKDWDLFAFLGRWNPTFGSPIWSLMVQAAIAIIMIVAVGTGWGRDTIDDSLSWLGSNATWTGLGKLPWDEYYGGFNTLFAATAPVFWTFFLATGISLFALRQQDRTVPRPFSVPFFPVLPLIFCAACAFFLYGALSYAKALSLIGWLPLVIGLPLYYLSRRTSAEEGSAAEPAAAPPPAPAEEKPAEAAPTFIPPPAAAPEPATVNEVGMHLRDEPEAPAPHGDGFPPLDSGAPPHQP